MILVLWQAIGLEVAMRALVVAGLVAAVGALRGRGVGSMAIPRVRSLREAVLVEASLIDANLSGFELSRALMSWVDLTGADLAGAYLTGATYDKNTRFPYGFDPEERGMVRRLRR